MTSKSRNFFIGDLMLVLVEKKLYVRGGHGNDERNSLSVECKLFNFKKGKCSSLGVKVKGQELTTSYAFAVDKGSTIKA